MNYYVWSDEKILPGRVETSLILTEDAVNKNGYLLFSKDNAFGCCHMGRYLLDVEIPSDAKICELKKKWINVLRFRAGILGYLYPR